ncbi:MAG: hypothetical protein AB8F74_13340, partial [Saprospiraceae bacterium]
MLSHYIGYSLALWKSQTNRNEAGLACIPTTSLALWQSQTNSYFCTILLRNIGKNYFQKDSMENNFIAAAKEAYVVTPVSSLVVLETQADYERFDIKKSKNSLENASIGNSGAVPEPAEWLLIILVFLMTGWFYFRR